MRLPTGVLFEFLAMLFGFPAGRDFMLFEFPKVLFEFLAMLFESV